MNQTSTAAVSYQISTETGQIGTINQRVEHLIRLYVKSSRNDLQRETGLTARQVGCAVWHLIESGAVRTCGTAIDSITHREVELLEINPTPEIIFHKVTAAEKLEKIKDLCTNAGWTYGLSEEILKIIG